jgi:large subunit ribosomal protein L18
MSRITSHRQARTRRHLRLRQRVKGTEDTKNANKSTKSRMVGSVIAERAKEKGVTSVVFDRGGYRYHGRVQELAEGARQGGLVF